MPPIKVMLVDDHEVVRLGLKALLEGEPGFSVVGEAASGCEAVEEACRLRPDVVVMDVRLPDISGVEACREIRSAHPEIKVLMLTSFGDQEAVTASLVAGAQGYVLKKIWSQDLLNAIRQVSRGQTILDPLVTNRVVGRLKEAGAEGGSEPLTPQEKKVLALIAEAKTNREIAEALFLSEKTVRNYVSNVFRKLNLDHRAQAVLYAHRLKGSLPE